MHKILQVKMNIIAINIIVLCHLMIYLLTTSLKSLNTEYDKEVTGGFLNELKNNNNLPDHFHVEGLGH